MAAKQARCVTLTCFARKARSYEAVAGRTTSIGSTHMPIAFPPPALPQAIPVAQIPRGTLAVPYAFGKYRVHLVGFEDCDADELQKLISTSADAEKLVLGLANLAYRSGELSARVRYAVAGNQLYVLLIKRPLRKISGSPEITRFFAPSAQSDFNFSRFERERVLASGYADRAGLTVQARFIDAPGDHADLNLRAAPDPEARHVHVHFDAGNQGSRFAGRNLIGGGLSASTGGLEASVQLKTSISGEEDEQTQGDYIEGSAQLSQVTRAGIFGLSGKRLSFTLDGPPEVDGWFQEYGAEWSNVLRASTSSRLVGRVRVAYADRQSERASDEFDLFHERYTALEVNPAYTWQTGGHHLDASVSLLIGQAGSLHNSAADENFQLARPLLRYGFRFSERYAVSLMAASQWTGVVVPEYQQWTLGGIDTMAAYLPAAFFGDSGYYLRAGGEMSWALAKGWKTAIQIFGEHGNVQSEAGSDAATDGITDAGVGVGASWKRSLDLKLLAARPIGAAEADEDMRADYYAVLSLSY